MDNRELTNILEKYQKLLRLQDWEIQIEWKHLNDFPEDFKGSLAVTHLSLGNKNARIMVLPLEEAGARTNPDTHYNIERSIIHELMHLHMEGIETYLSKNESHAAIHAKEFACESVAWALKPEPSTTNTKQEE